MPKCTSLAVQHCARLQQLLFHSLLPALPGGLLHFPETLHSLLDLTVQPPFAWAMPAPCQGFPLPWLTSSPSPAEGQSQQPHCLLPSSITTLLPVFWLALRAANAEPPAQLGRAHAHPSNGKGQVCHPIAAHQCFQLCPIPLALGCGFMQHSETCPPQPAPLFPCQCSCRFHYLALCF